MNEQLLTDVRRFAADPEADEFSAALLVNRALEDELDVPALRERVQRLVDHCSEPLQPWLYLAELGYTGNAISYDAIDNSRLDWLLGQRRGIPISLGVLLIHVARSLGLRAVGINFPGHFLVRVGTQLVDPFRMTPTSEQECLAGLAEASSPVDPAEAFVEASPLAVLLRMLNNLKYQFAQRGEWHRGLDMLDLQLAVEPENPRLLIERGEMWRHLGAIAPAREALELAIAHADGRDAEAVRLAQERLGNLSGDDGVLH